MDFENEKLILIDKTHEEFILIDDDFRWFVESIVEYKNKAYLMLHFIDPNSSFVNYKYFFIENKFVDNCQGWFFEYFDMEFKLVNDEYIFADNFDGDEIHLSFELLLHYKHMYLMDLHSRLKSLNESRELNEIIKNFGENKKKRGI